MSWHVGTGCVIVGFIISFSLRKALCRILLFVGISWWKRASMSSLQIRHVFLVFTVDTPFWLRFFDLTLLVEHISIEKVLREKVVNENASSRPMIPFLIKFWRKKKWCISKNFTRLLFFGSYFSYIHFRVSFILYLQSWIRILSDTLVNFSERSFCAHILMDSSIHSIFYSF